MHLVTLYFGALKAPAKLKESDARLMQWLLDFSANDGVPHSYDQLAKLYRPLETEDGLKQIEKRIYKLVGLALNKYSYEEKFREKIAWCFCILQFPIDFDHGEDDIKLDYNETIIEYRCDGFYFHREDPFNPTEINPFPWSIKEIDDLLASTFELLDRDVFFWWKSGERTLDDFAENYQKQKITHRTKEQIVEKLKLYLPKLDHTNENWLSAESPKVKWDRKTRNIPKVNDDAVRQLGSNINMSNNRINVLEILYVQWLSEGMQSAYVPNCALLANKLKIKNETMLRDWFDGRKRIFQDDYENNVKLNERVAKDTVRTMGYTDKERLWKEILETKAALMHKEQREQNVPQQNYEMITLNDQRNETNRKRGNIRVCSADQQTFDDEQETERRKKLHEENWETFTPIWPLERWYPD